MSGFHLVRSAAVAALVTAALLAVLACGAPPGCPQCGREECRNLAFTIHLADGGRVQTCCPRCALRYIQEEKPEVASLEAHAFDTARPIDVDRAFWVEGSDVHPCSHGVEGPPKDERGCCLEAVYDRCLPSLLAFSDPVGAAAFAREHGGFLTSFEKIRGQQP